MSYGNPRDQLARVDVILASLLPTNSGYEGAQLPRRCNSECQHYLPGRRGATATCKHSRGNPIQVHSGDVCEYNLPPRVTQAV